MRLTSPNLIKPKIGGDPDIWGDKLNKNLDLQSQFNKSLVTDGERQDQELVRLENEKINKSDIDTLVKNVVDNYVDTVTKPELGNHVETVNKPELDRYTETKKSEINTFTDEQKEELDAHEKVKEGEITQFVEGKKEELVQYVDNVNKVELNSHTQKKKDEINTFTEEQKAELDAHEKLKEGQLDSYEKEKESQLNSHVETVNKVELQNYVNVKKEDINSFTEEQKIELDEHEKVKEGEINTHVTSKIGEIDSHVETKKVEINDFTEEQKLELDAYEKTKETELENFKDEKKVEITSHTDAEIERINATGITGKQDKTDESLETNDKTVVGAINELLTGKENLIVRSNAIDSDSTTNVATSKAVNDLRLEVNKKTINAGTGLATTVDVGGGQTINITPKNESILVDDDSIWVNIVNDFVTGGVNKVASAESIKVLKQLIDTLGGGGATKLLRTAEALGEYDYIGNLAISGTSIAVGSRLFNPTLYLDGVRIEENRYSVEFETGLITLNEAYADYEVVWVVEDKMPYHITFCFPTMNLLLASEDIKSRIQLNNVIKILGASDEDDGGHYLVKCEDTPKLNAVQIDEGKYLNEIPNTKISAIKAEVEQNKIDILSKLDKGGYDGTAETLKRLIDTKVDISKDTNGDSAKAYIEKTKNCHFASGWYKIAEAEVYQSTTNAVIEIIGASGYNANTPSQNTNAKIIIRGGNGDPEGISIACLCMGNVGFITHTSYFKLPDSNIYEIFIRFGSVYTSQAIVNAYNEDRYIKIFSESREENSANPTNSISAIPVFTSSNSPMLKSPNGWAKFANGLIVQWGQAGGYEGFSGGFTSKRIDVNLPIAFTDYTYAICGSEQLGNDYEAYKTKIQFSVKNTSSFYIAYIKTDANTTTYINGVKWLAIGY